MTHKLAPFLPAILVAPLAFAIHYTADFGLAYQGGVEAWNSGHPQRLVTWTATPFLAVVMAAITRVSSVDVASPSFMAIDLIVWGALLAAVWSRMRDRVPPRFWWSTAAALLVAWVYKALVVRGCWI